MTESLLTLKDLDDLTFKQLREGKLMGILKKKIEVKLKKAKKTVDEHAILCSIGSTWLWCYLIWGKTALDLLSHDEMEDFLLEITTLLGIGKGSVKLLITQAETIQDIYNVVAKEAYTLSRGSCQKIRARFGLKPGKVYDKNPYTGKKRKPLHEERF